MGIGRVLMFLAAVLVIGIAAVATMPARRGALHHAAFAYAPFAAGDADLALPAGYEAVDPFDSNTPYCGMFWSHQAPPMGSRMALVRRTDGPFEVQVILAPRAALEPTILEELDRFAGHPDAERRLEARRTTASGQTVELRAVRIPNPVHPEGDATYVLGYALLDDLALVLNGGGPSDRFDAEGLAAIVEGITLPR